MKYALAITACVGLVACGGGENENAGSATARPQVSGYLPTDISRATSRSDAIVSSGQSVGQSSQNLQTDVFTADLSNVRSVMSRSTNSLTEACYHSGSISTTVSAGNAFNVTFVQCSQMDGTVIDGAIDYVTTEADENLAVSMDMHYQDMRITQANSGEYVYLDGDMRAEILLYGDPGYMRMSSDLFVAETGGERITLNDYTYNIVLDDQTTQIDFNYFITNADGIYHVRTDGKLVANVEQNRYEGTFYIEGENAIYKIELTLNSETATLSIDEGKDGSYESESTVTLQGITG